MSGRQPRVFGVLGFASTHDALDAEVVLQQGGLEVLPIPSPKSIGALCGIALRIPLEQVERACERLSIAGIDIAATSEIVDL